MAVPDVTKQYIADQPERVIRVTRGLIHPETRPAYLRAIRVKSRRLRRRLRGTAAVPSTASRCLVCGSASIQKQSFTHRTRPGRTFRMRLCQACGYVANPDNTVDYKAFTSPEQFRPAARIGTPDVPGREFGMAEMGVAMLGRSDLSVLVYGIGRSVDYQHIAALPEVARVAMGDIVDFGGIDDFVNLSEGTTEKFDLVIASEVVEHFHEPREDFRRMLGMVTLAGLVICSTNVYDGGDLAKQTYLFHGGHVSYYRARSLQLLARANRMYVDFRLPHIAIGAGGPRKRYLLFSASQATMQRVVGYFGDHPFAPSESLTAPAPPVAAPLSSALSSAEGPADGVAGGPAPSEHVLEQVRAKVVVATA